MKPRLRITRRKRGGSSLPAPAPPLDLTTEIEQSLEARDKLEASIPRLDDQRNQAKLAFLRDLAGSPLATEVDPNAAQVKFAAWKVEEARAAEQRDSLRQLFSLFQDRIEQYKAASPAETVLALERILARSEQEHARPGADLAAINSRVGKLTKEMEALQTKASSGPTREPKDKPTSPQQRSAKKRPAKGKSKPRESGNN
jgi:hypothetical protein